MNTIITGASRGIGHELAKLCLINGHNLLAISRDQQKLETLKQYQKQSELIILPIDLSQIDQIPTIQAKIKHWQTVNLLYNNAGLLIKKDFQQLSPTDFLNSLKVNFLAPALIIQQILNQANQQTHIINITTMGAIQGSVKFPGLAAYSSSKAAVTNLTEVLAEELKATGTTINNIALGAVQTQMLEQAFPGYQAPTTAAQMAKFLYDFGLNQKNIYHGKTLQCSKSTP